MWTETGVYEITHKATSSRESERERERGKDREGERRRGWAATLRGQRTRRRTARGSNEDEEGVERNRGRERGSERGGWWADKRGSVAGRMGLSFYREVVNSLSALGDDGDLTALVSEAVFPLTKVGEV